MTLIPRSFKFKKVECEVGVSPSCFTSIGIPSSWPEDPCASSVLIGRVIRWSSVERGDTSHFLLRWSCTSAVSFVIAAEQGKQYVSTRTVRSVSWIYSLLLKLFPLSQTRRYKMVVPRCWTLSVFLQVLFLIEEGTCCRNRKAPSFITE